ncbi:MAG TPA: glycine cleavage system protein H [Candidatus Methylomirabilis sp.]|nr:glycine cleavage system protein H [Candidatus Methylomirabilis sp.]
MEGFRFVDIFATKGIEYIIVMAFLAAFIYFSRYLAYRPGVEKQEGPAGSMGYFRIPEGLFYHQGHGWLRPEPGSIGVVGLDDFAQKLVGPVDSLELPGVGDRLAQGDKGWSLVVGSVKIPMLSPVDGEVVAVNPEVLRSPGILGTDPYGKGWLFKVRSPRIAADIRNLLSGKLARSWMENALSMLHPMNPEHLGPVLQDGGLPVEGLARILGGDRWDELARTHLLTDGE